MQTQRDHVHAHQFQMTRMSNSLVAGDSAGVDNPFQRPVVGLLTGVLLAVLVVGGYAVYGWLVPGGDTSWRRPGTIIVEKESGDRYVFAGGKLLPVRNMTSALLLQGPSATVELVSHTALRGVPRGPVIGLPGAPQVLPAAADLVGGPWMACLTGRTVRLDLDPAAPATPLAPGEFTLVASAGKRYLLWRGTKSEIADDAVPIALGAAGATPATAPAIWLDAVADGEPITIPKVPKHGAKGPKVAGHPYRIGQVFTQAGGGAQRFVLRSDGLAPVSETAFTLLQAVSSPPVALSAADIVTAPASTDRSLTGFLSALAGVTFRDPAGGALCLRQSPAGAELVLSARGYRAGTPPAVLAPGSAVLAYALPIPTTQQTPEPWLITEDGVRYDVSGENVLSSLRLSGPQIGIPAPWLTALPTGPALSRAALTATEEGS
ncbi:type VII secretion protein EccB [Winogradskya consettensis]|uniref:Type VII secretion protein EccB n=1 Tax=Winogradskya consettensis TaxID=113560 RepID=A0A919SDL9_9ACTN|nr:type VII secretion protein EccB [Actinoplanes consettensis]GIM69799.1 type VII secretion protein EccB [Actinoplanes consettensis]